MIQAIALNRLKLLYRVMIASQRLSYYERKSQVPFCLLYISFYFFHSFKLTFETEKKTESVHWMNNRVKLKIQIMENKVSAAQINNRDHNIYLQHHKTSYIWLILAQLREH